MPNLPSDIAKDQHPRRVALRTCGNHRSINAFTPMHFGYDLKGRFSGSYYIRRLVGHVLTQTSAQGLLETQYLLGGLLRGCNWRRLEAATPAASDWRLGDSVRRLETLVVVPQREPIGPRYCYCDRSGKNKLEQEISAHGHAAKSTTSKVAIFIGHHMGIIHWASYGPGASPSFLFPFV